MIIVTMKLEPDSEGVMSRVAGGGPQSQYCWHIGEPFPILHAWLEHVLRLYADGEELEALKNLIPVAEPRAKVAEIEGADAAYACEILLATYRH